MNAKLLDVFLKNFVRVVAGVLLIIVAALGWSYVKQGQELKKAKDELTGTKTAYHQLAADKAILETAYVKRGDLLAQAKTAWEDEMKENKKLREQLRGVVETTFAVNSFPQVGPPDRVVTGPDGYIYHEIDFANEAGEVGPPVGYVKIANESGTVTEKVFNHEIHVDNAIAIDETTGRISVYSKAAYVLTEPNLTDPEAPWLGRPYPLKITGGTLTFDPKKPVTTGKIPDRWIWGAHLNAGAFVGGTQFGLAYGGRVDVTSVGWGKTKNDLDFKLFGVGFNANRSYVDVSVVPIYYRVGNHLPLARDLYIGAGAGLTPMSPSYFLTLSTTL